MKKSALTLAIVLLSVIVRAQTWRTNADSLIVNNIFSNEINHVDIYAFPDMLTSNDTIFSIDGDTILVPYQSCFGYFVDLLPYAHWAHPCKYCFVASSLTNTMVSCEMPPVCDSLSVVSLFPRPVINPIDPVFDTISPMIKHGGTDPKHLWAVLICGDEGKWAGREMEYGSEYWFDLSCIYTVLTNNGYLEREFIEDSIIEGQIIVMAPSEIREKYKIRDLNGNETYYCNGEGGDFFYKKDPDGYTYHSRGNIENIFKCFSGDSICLHDYTQFGLRKLDEKDQLFIFVTGHGNCDLQTNSSYFYVHKDDGSRDIITDNNLISWLRNIKCSQMTLFMENCYSGRFVDKFLDDIQNENCLCKNRIGQSAASSDGLSYAEFYKVYHDGDNFSNRRYVSEFVYYWASSALGYYPYFCIRDSLDGQVVKDGPWTPTNRRIGNHSMNWEHYFGLSNAPSHDDYDKNPDTDEDGILSFKELFEFANNLDTWSYQGYYYPHANDTAHTNFNNDEYQPEFPQQRYESTFTEESATIVGYEGQVDGITNSGTATQPYRLCGDIWVGPDSELTMRDDMQSPQYVRIYVMPSGKLTLDGATLTNLPEQGSPMWNGVQVWGDASKHQFIENGHCWQGRLEMMNNSIISNAIVGVDVWNPKDYSTTGGIVKAVDSHFINNGMAVFFHPYENQYKHPNHPEEIVVNDNLSNFRRCRFSIDWNYIGPDEFEMHANLFRVRGVGFFGCDFQFHDNVHSSPWPMGLHAYDAGFKLKGANPLYLNPCYGYYNSAFDGFYKAVVIVNDGSVSLRPVTVQSTNFTDNSFGVFSVNTDFVTVINSSFEIGQDSTICAAGIFAESTPNFTIEQDTFALASYYPYETYGIVIKNSKSQNQIYMNSFEGLYCANLSVGRNNTWMLPRSTSDAKADILGLEYRCNENIDNRCDFYVLGGNNIYRLGIQTNQGTTDLPANNTFSSGNRFNFINHGNYGINYFYSSSQQQGFPTVKLGVTTTLAKDTINCRPHYGCGGISYNDTLTPVLSDTQRLQRETDYYEAYSAFKAIQTAYYNLIDGGDTEGEIGDIRSATPSDLWALRAQLLGHSPYLTDDVLINMLGRDDVFPQSVLFEILASNPDELKSDSLMNFLQNKDNPLPNYMIDLLRLVGEGTTARTAMEAQMARYSQTFRLAAGDMVRSILNDTVVNKTALVGWLGNMRDLESDREIISLYLEEGDTTRAFALANMLPSIYGLTESDLAEHYDYIALLNLYKGLLVKGRNVAQLDSTERVSVEHLADYSTGKPHAMARAILEGVYGYRYDDCPSGVDLNYPERGIGNMWDVPSNEELGKADGFVVEVSPNPANTWVAIDYTLPEGATKARVKISNILGTTVATCDLQGKETQRVIDLRGLASGIYTYTVYCGNYSQTGKLVIVK